MKEQDYMKIMNKLREDYISEAVSWDGTAQKNRRSIRRMSYGIGAIAAALAVTVGGIGYKVYRDRLTANPNPEDSDIAIEQLNIFGGHGELRGYLDSQGGSIFRDDMYFYAENVKWAADGSTPLINIEGEKMPHLLTDGKQLYTQHDGNVYITDSYGKETLAFSLGKLNAAKRIRLLPDGDYFVTGTYTVDAAALSSAEMQAGSVPMPYTDGGFLAVCTVICDPESGEQVTLRVVQTESGDSIDYQNYLSSERICIDSSEEGWYYYHPEDMAVYYAPFDMQPDSSNRVFTGITGADDNELAELTGFHVFDDILYYECCVRSENENGAVRTIAELHTVKHGSDQESVNMRGDYDMAANDPASDYPCYTYFGADYMYGVMQKQTDTGLTFKVMRHAYDAFDGDQTVFEVPVSELYGDQIPDRMERPDMIFGDTGDYLFFTLPEEGINGEDMVQVNLRTGTWFYLGENYRTTQTQQTDDLTAELTSDEGYCSPERFAQYYIPPENVAKDLDKIECYRMLPFAKASESRLDTEALGSHLPGGGAWSRRDPDASRMSYTAALDCITTGEPISGWDIMAELCKLNAGYDAEAYFNNNMLSDREFWLDDSGKEFFYVLIYGPDNGMGEIDRAEFYYFRFDDNEKQYHFMYIPDRSTEGGKPQQKPVQQNTAGDTNVLGGKGTVHPYLNSYDLQYAEDDEWYYDLSSAKRAKKEPDAQQLQFEPLPKDVASLLYSEDDRLSLLTDGTDLYIGMEGALYNILSDGTWLFLCDFVDAAGDVPFQKDTIRIEKVHLMHDDTLFVIVSGALAVSGEACLYTYMLHVGTYDVQLLTSSNASDEEMLIWENGCYTEDYVYTVTDNGGILNMYSPEGEISLNLALHTNMHLTGDKWFIGADGKLWFIQNNGWYQMELDDRKQGFMEPKVVLENAPHFEVCEPIRGSMKMLTYFDPGEKTGMKLCNYDGSDAYEMLKGAPCRILGAYCDGGVYHIAAEVGWAADAPDPDLPPEIVFITKDGSSVSSIGAPKES